MPAEVVLVAEDPGGNDGPNGETRTAQVGPSSKDSESQVRHNNDITELYNKPTVGKLEYFIENLRADDTEVYYTNIKKCDEIHGDESWKNPEAQKKCRQYLPEEFQLLSPSVIIPLGQPAIKEVFSVLGYSGNDFSGSAGEYVRAKDSSQHQIATYGDDPTIVPAYHFGRAESAISRGQWKKDDLGNEQADYDGYKKPYYDELINAVQSVLYTTTN